MGEKRVLPEPLKKVLDYDVALTNKCVKYVDQKYGPLAKYKGLLKGLEISCHGIPWLVVTASLIFLFSSVRQLLVNIFIALIVDIIVVAVVKAISRRRRPAGNKNDENLPSISVDKFSFPSGHATRAVMLGVLLPLQYDLFLVVSLALVGWAGAVCISRILLQRHHVLDVVGGVVIGFLEAVILSQLWLSEESAQALVNFFLDETQAGATYHV